MIYKGLGLITNTESPIVVVLRYVDNNPCPHVLSASAHCASKSHKWLHGASILPRGYPLSYQPAKCALPNRRHHRLQDSGTRHPHRAQSSRDARRREDCSRVRFFKTDPMDYSRLNVTLSAAFASPNPTLRTSFYSPRETTITSTT
jgi:hypothetical protein